MCNVYKMAYQKFLFYGWLALLGLLFLARSAWADPLPPRLVKDINPALASSNPEKLIDVGGMLYFQATTPENGKELWRSNGTALGTALVRDIKVGPGDTTIGELTPISGTLFFNVQFKQDAALWKVTGPAATADQVVKLAAPVTGTVESIYDLVDIHGELDFFHAQDTGSAQNYELWTTDGSKAHTHLITALPSTVRPANMVDLAGVAYFSAGAITGGGTALWKSDGTAAGTLPIKTFQFGVDAANNAWPMAIRDRLYLVGSDGVDGAELWKSDGTETNTKRLANINPTAGSNPSDVTVLDDKLYFSADDGAHGAELWTSNGTEASTVLIKDINSGSAGSQPRDFVMRDGILYFVADDDEHGGELWKSDGTDVGTLLVKDVITGTQGSLPTQLVAWQNAIYFLAANGNGGTELWQSDGTAPGTMLVMTVNQTTNLPVGFTPSLVAASGQLFFTANMDETGAELWGLGGCPNGCNNYLPLIKR